MKGWHQGRRKIRGAIMKINQNAEVEETVVEMEGAKDVTMKILIGLKEGSENIIMRLFKVMPGGNTPLHTHDFEHVTMVQKGKGVLVDEKGNEHEYTEGMSAFVPSNQEHQFKNPYEAPFEFLCIILNQNQ